MNRPTWDEYFMNIAKLASTRATCIRRSVGALIVRENNILSTGYNGVPSGIEHCTSKTCIRNVRRIPSGQQLDICMGLHAEQNAIIQAAKHGISIRGAKIYVTTFPCLTCTKMIINSGMIEVIYNADYDDSESKRMLNEANINVRRVANG